MATETTTTTNETTDVVETPTPKRTRARKAPAQDAPVAETIKTRPQYTAEITEAVRLAKAARGMSKHAPGAKQHVMVRAVVGVDATAAEIVKASGAKSEKQLRAIANGSAPTEDVAVLRPLGGQFDDPWCRGRNLASILVAMVDQAKARS